MTSPFGSYSPHRTRSTRDDDGSSEANSQSRASSCSSGSHPRHKRSSTKILKQWFAIHSRWPYPSPAEKQFLSLQTGMSAKQVSSWFVNTRRRNGHRLAETWLPPTCQGSSLLARSAPVDALPKMDNAARSSQWGDKTPMARWRDSPPEDDHVSVHSIAQAIQDPTSAFSSINDGIINSGKYGSLQPLSIYDFPGSSESSNSSIGSHSVASTSGSRNDFDGRSWKHKKRGTTQAARFISATIEGENHSASRPYQCTFCTDRFKSRYDWTRHEQTLHLTLEQWTCLPFGPVHVDLAGLDIQCALCGAKDPEDAHIAIHRTLECSSRATSARTFFRKDHLRQHLRFAHEIEQMTESMEGWRTKQDNVKSRCGFCGEKFTRWSERNDHLADHFRDGAHMKDWKGCRGLEPAIALRVNNAMPPYLIGVEAADMDPFSASRGTIKKVSSPSNLTAQRATPTSFESLTARLGDYVRIARENCLDLSDQALRRQARLILYEDDDSWNQTPADNAEWLQMFKLGYGLAGENPCSTGHMSIAQRSGTASAGLVPFTIQTLRQAAGSDQFMLPFDFEDGGEPSNTVSGANATSMAIPWSWQTPECLAEFSQLCQALNSDAISPEGEDGPGVPLF